ncbi:PID-CTERM protein-sorting domain-containing protein [Zunongwangia sp. H14]|uniref:PID-CTERM protein-sorting domain-containing protein n=1 Tax=Zunongwangia sp. H14 TaxID=3240792 RepID=UPI003566DEF0
MEILRKYKKIAFGVILMLLLFLNMQSFAQEPCDPGERFCNGECRPARECRPGVPPPPGLPIDFGISALIASGLALGAYHLRKKKED